MRRSPHLKTYGAYVATVNDEREQDAGLVERDRREKRRVGARIHLAVVDEGTDVWSSY